MPIYTDPNDPNNPKYVAPVVTPVETTTPAVEKTKGAGIGIGAIIVIALIAIAAYFFFNGKKDTPATVGQDVGHAASATYGAVQNAGHAVKDAVTPAKK